MLIANFAAQAHFLPLVRTFLIAPARPVRHPELMKKRTARSAQSPARARATIHDVAREAGVSIYTVSRTLTNASGVHPEKRDQVLEVCRQLGVRPRPLARGRHFALVIQTQDRRQIAGYTPMLAFQLLAELSTRGMGLTLFCDEQLAQLPRMLFDGIFAVTWDSAAIELLASLEKSTPTLVINRFSLTSRFHVIGWDHQAEGRVAAEYLLARGHQRLGIIAEPPGTRQSTQNRLSGYRAACRAAGCPLDEHRVELLESRDQLAVALGRVLATNADALYVPGQGRLGPEAVQILQSTLKVRVPRDISVVSGEHPGWSTLLTPPLTTVDAPLELLARRSVDHMMKLVEKRPAQPTEVLLDTPIIERKSVRDRRTEAAPLRRSA